MAHGRTAKGFLETPVWMTYPLLLSPAPFGSEPMGTGLRAPRIFKAGFPSFPFYKNHTRWLLWVPSEDMLLYGPNAFLGSAQATTTGARLTVRGQ